MDKNKIVSMVIILAIVVVIAGGLSRAAARDSLTLAEYAQQHQLSQTDASEQNSSSSGSGNQPSGNRPSESGQPSASPEAPSPFPSASSSPDDTEDTSRLTGAALNGISVLEQRVQLTEGFYYEPISEKLRRYMTGISFPAAQKEEGLPSPEITFDELRYVHVLHYDFDGNPTEGELICNEYIAQDLLEIFYELYRNEYQLERILLIDEYEGSHTNSMEDNNTFCFHYYMPEENGALSKHAYGLAVDINPLYNPLVTYGEDGQEIISPSAALPYVDRTSGFPYKIDENDLCYKLFIRHGFTWGGNRNNAKAYQHFQKTKP